MVRRNDKGCILDLENPRFCEWSNTVAGMANSDDVFDKLILCELCNKHDMLKATSFSNNLYRDIASAIRKTDGNSY